MIRAGRFKKLGRDWIVGWELQCHAQPTGGLNQLSKNRLIINPSRFHLLHRGHSNEERLWYGLSAFSWGGFPQALGKQSSFPP